MRQAFEKFLTFLAHLAGVITHGFCVGAGAGVGFAVVIEWMF